MFDLSVVARVLIAALLFLQAGLLILRRLRLPAETMPEKLALSFGLGAGALAWQMQAYSFLQIPFSLSRLLPVWGACWALHWLFDRKRRHPPKKEASPKLHRAGSRSRGVLSIPLFLLGGLVLVAAVVLPLHRWDAWAIWDLKARAFLHHMSILPFLEDAAQGYSHLDYPVLMPLTGTFLYLVLGRSSDIVIIIPAAFYIAALGIFWGFVKRRSKGATAPLLTLGLATLPPFVHWSLSFHAETPLIFFCLTSWIAFFEFLEERDSSYLVLTGLSAGLGTQMREEGLFLILPQAAIMLGLWWRGSQSPVAIVLRFFAPILLMAAPWTLYRSIWSPHGAGTTSAENIARVFENTGQIPALFTVVGSWLTNSSQLGAFVLLLPICIVLVGFRYRAYLLPLRSDHFLLLIAGWSAVPYFVFLLANPIWLERFRLGRYLDLWLVAIYLLLALEVIRRWHSGISPTRLTRTLAALILGIWVLSDATLALRPNPDYYPRGILSLARESYVPALAWARLENLVDRNSWQARFDRHGLSRILSEIENRAPASANVALLVEGGWAPASNDDHSFVLRKSQSLVYPRQVYPVIDSRVLTVRNLQEYRVGAVVGYRRQLPSTLRCEERIAITSDVQICVLSWYGE